VWLHKKSIIRPDTQGKMFFITAMCRPGSASWEETKANLFSFDFWENAPSFVGLDMLELETLNV
jgi:hypothetical protein